MSGASKLRTATVDELAYLRDQGHVVELIDGEIVYKALPTPAHGDAQSRINGLLHGFNRRSGGPQGPGGWWLMTEVEVLYPKTREVFRHDVLGFRRELYPKRPEGLPVRARPDWVCEILSPSTAHYDVVKKQRTLHAHGVPHYWIVDPTNRLLTVLRWEEEQYKRVLDAGVGDVVRAEPFDAIEIDVREIFGAEDEDESIAAG
ncbi:MAG TPA: Uma2 family endonuclease [Sandaracinaceae bacterium]